MDSVASVIIGFTPFHLIPMRELVAIADGDIHVFHPQASQRGAFDEHMQVSYLGDCHLPQRSRWAKYFTARRDIDRIMRSGRPVDLYLPHPHNPLANFAFFHAMPCRCFIYQDGILNYYDAPASFARFGERWRQRAKGLAVGSRYQFYKGHLSGIDAHAVAGGFFTHPQRVVEARKFPLLRKLSFNQVSVSSTSATRRDVLFLDQPIELSVGVGRAKELRRFALEYTNALDGRVLYKPHYAQGHIRTCDPSWVPLDPMLSSLPAEWAVTDLKLAHVVSFCTSALANITMSDNQVECHATAAGSIPVTVDGRLTDLGEVMSGLGVKVVRVTKQSG